MSENPEITLETLQKPWTRKQYMFAMGVVGGKSGKDAAIEAGYAPKAASEQASRMLADARFKHIQDFINGRLNKTAEKHEITAERILKQIASIAFGDVRGLFDSEGRLIPAVELDDSTAASIAAMEFNTVEHGEGEVTHIAKVKQADKLKALELLGKHLKLFTDKVEHSGDKDSPVLVQIVDDLPRKTK